MPTEQIPNLVSEQWWQTAMLSRMSLVCLLVMVGGLAVLVLGASALVRLRQVQLRGKSATATGMSGACLSSVLDCGPEHRDPILQSGTATVEFALLFPILLIVALMLVQTMLVMAGNLMVHYAAFAATRSAIVQIPADYRYAGGESSNTMIADSGSPKFDAIRQAAVMAVVPVSGRLSTGANTDSFVQGLTAMYSAYGRTAPGWVTRLAADRLRYAQANTNIYVYRAEVESDQQSVRFVETTAWGPHDAVTVRVEHRLNLSIPYVARIFADGAQASGRGYYANVAAQYTLTNEGLSRELPPLPGLPRRP